MKPHLKVNHVSFNILTCVHPDYITLSHCRAKWHFSGNGHTK